MQTRLARAAAAALAVLAASGCAPRQMELEIELELELTADVPGAPEALPAPWTLTASDGSGLQLARVEAHGVIEGPLAFTELHLHFHNPEPRVREGRFAIALPHGASIARFAMEDEGHLLEAEVVGKSFARRVYEDFLHRREDPALLERAAANLFTARVFPIAARADKHLVIAFAHELAGGDYVLPLRGLPVTPRIDVRVDAVRSGGTRDAYELRERDWLPDRDFVIAAAGLAGLATGGPVAAAEPTGIVAGRLIAAAVPLGAGPVTADPPDALTLLVDTSGSRARDFARYARAVRELVAELAARYGRALELELVAFDQEVRTLYRGPAGSYGAAEHAARRARGAAGASDLGAALAWLAGMGVHHRAAIVTDGVLTAGAELPAILAELAEPNRHEEVPRLERLDVVLAGGVRDGALAAALVRAGLPRAGAVLDLDRGAADVAAGLGEAVLVDVALDVPGAAWVSPRVVPAVRAGQPVMVYARLPASSSAAAPPRTIELVVAGQRRTLALAAASEPLLERAIAGAEIEELERTLRATTDRKAAEARRRDLEQRAIAARIVSSQTSMLVLETEADYARYGIDRSALAELLVVGPDGIATVPRSRPALAPGFRLPGGRFGQAMELSEGKLSLPGHAADPQLTRAQAIEMARSSGILGAALRDGASLAALSASSGFALDAPDAPDAPGAPGPTAPAAPWTGRFAEVMRALAEDRLDHALALARRWHAAAPDDLLALVALGEVLEARGRAAAAARYYGSIIDLHPGRADL
ncbi:MAG TPA: VIT domain-containing protein, partial [Kofleriaceae bacterium]|nr:VIT domain-containing protein [Kofleriaceae bacterium]